MVRLLCVLCSFLAACASGGGPRDDRTTDVSTDGAADTAGEAFAADATDEVADAAQDPGMDAALADPCAFARGDVRSVREGTVVRVGNGRIVLAIHLDSGTWDLALQDGRIVVAGAHAAAAWRESDKDAIRTTREGTLACAAAPLVDRLGEGVAVEVRQSGVAPALAVRFEVRAGATFVTVGTTLSDCSAAGLPVTRLSPIVAEASRGGGLHVGADPATHRVLDNGYDVFFDFDARVQVVGEAPSALFGPGTAANWTLAAVDPADGRSVVAGYMTAVSGVGVVALDYDATASVARQERRPFTRFEGLSHYLDPWLPAADASGCRSTASEVLYLDIAPASVFDGLEGWADRRAAYAGRTVRTTVPSGWNSWGGGGGSGGLGQDINLERMTTNLDLAVADLAPWGMTHFLIDDGWQKAKGEWVPHPERFPDRDGVNGMAWLAQRATDAGLVPGLWIAPFSVDKDGAVAAAHPDWIVPVGGFGAALVPTSQSLLDLSNPAVLDWIEATFRRLADDWGFRWFKVDFAYYALFATGLSDPHATAGSAYAAALRRIRDAIGPDSFLLVVSASGQSMDVADGDRLTLDNMPRWGDPTGIGDQGIKPTYRTIARRYYMNHHLWINHPDLVFFRDGQGLTLAEARTWVSAVALMGGIVKLGETYEALHAHPEWLALVRPLLPVYPRSGRPLDLFDREYPEVWDLPASRDDAAWHTVGLFHWGKNRDIGGPAPADEVPEERSVHLADLGLDPGATHLVLDAWERTWTWTTGPAITRTLDPRTAAVLIVRPAPDRPAVVLTTRHLLGGAVEVTDEAWDAAAGRLSFAVDTVAGVAETLYVATAGRTMKGATADGVAIDVPAEIDGVVAIPVVPGTARTAIAIVFEQEPGARTFRAEGAEKRRGPQREKG